MREKDILALNCNKSVFTGGALALFGINLASVLLSILTLTIATPWLTCWRYRWEYEHTYINGRQLRFDGTGGSLFGYWLLWLLLTFITVGIYSIWLPVAVQRWVVARVHFADSPYARNTEVWDTPAPPVSHQAAPQAPPQAAPQAAPQAPRQAAPQAPPQAPKRPAPQPPIDRSVLKRCPGCGVNIPASAAFCPNCGFDCRKVPGPGQK